MIHVELVGRKGQAKSFLASTTGLHLQKRFALLGYMMVLFSTRIFHLELRGFAYTDAALDTEQTGVRATFRFYTGDHAPVSC